jgi:hypothetical protein
VTLRYNTCKVRIFVVGEKHQQRRENMILDVLIFLRHVLTLERMAVGSQLWFDARTFF